MGGQRGGYDLAGVGIPAEVQFPPGPSRLGAVLFDQPFTRPAELEARAVHQQMHGLGLAPCIGAAARPWAGHLQGGGPAAQGGVVRHWEIKAKQAHEGTDQALGLPERQAEHGPERQGGQDGEL